jgi:hypothetical protein
MAQMHEMGSAGLLSSALGDSMDNRKVVQPVMAQYFVLNTARPP